ncbi:MAG TPA: hypothetical protein DEH78_08620 [Solibacterales bacterium]|nr:hypothetical protein [Bryobacterales bacterium]
MSNNQALAAAANDAHNHWGGGGGVHNCGNQGTEYITYAQALAVKNSWIQAGGGAMMVGGVNYNRTACDSQSAIGYEIDLKLNPGGLAAAFNYHIAIDTQVVELPPQPKIDSQKDSWRIVNNLRKQEYRDRHGGSTTGYFDLPFKPW